MSETCEKCKYYLQNICGGIRKICEDYNEVPRVTEDEKKYWGKEGDASRYRKRSYWYSCGSGYSLEIVNNR